MKNKLTAVALKNTADGVLQDGGGLFLVKAGSRGKWTYRYSILGRRRDMGLGSWPSVSLADARKARDGWAAELAAGRDPIAVRDARRADAIAERDRNDPTFEELTNTIFEARKDRLRGKGERGRWLSPLVTHIHPKIGRKPISTLTRHEFADALRPIWRKKPPTAEKAFMRIRIVLREGKFMGYDCDPFEIEAAARILGDVLYQPTPIASTRWQDIPALYARLGDNVSDECLRLIILTCVRADAATGAQSDEFDGDIWTVPKDRVKGIEGVVSDFRVPLSIEAQEIVVRMQERSAGYIFSARKGRPITPTALEKRLDELGEAGRPHGMRTSFRTWVQDTDACSWDVSETVLGHRIGNKVERSYARSDLLERRRIVMQAWADYVTGKKSADVIPIRST